MSVDTIGEEDARGQFSDRPLKAKPSALATLKEYSSLRRLLEVITPDGIFFLEYNGWGLGYETVRVNDRVICQKTSLLWFVPHFDFKLVHCPG